MRTASFSSGEPRVASPSLLCASSQASWRTVMPLALKTLGSDQTLDLGGFRLGLGWFWFAFLGGDGPSDDVLGDIIFFCQVEQLSDLASSLWSQSSWHDTVCQSWDVIIPLLDDDKIEHGQVGVHNASTDRLSFALPSL